MTGVVYRGAVLVFPDRTLPWEAAGAVAVTWESLMPVVEHGGVQILLLGLGRTSNRRAVGLYVIKDGSGDEERGIGADDDAPQHRDAEAPQHLAAEK